MQVKAKAKYIRISPRKARLVVDVVRGLDLQDAFNRLTLLNKKAVGPVEKLLKSALANAEHNDELTKDNLFIKEFRVDDGPTAYRWMPRAFGRATPIRKRTSIFSLVLEEKIPTTKKKDKKTQKVETTTDKEKITDKIDPSVSTLKKQESSQALEEEHNEEKIDVKRKGGHRDMQQQEKNVKKEKGIFKKMFRRKSGM